MNKKKLRGQAVKRKLPQIVLVILLGLLCLIMFLPFCWIISTSLRSPADSFKMPPSFFPTSFQYQNYVSVFTRFPFARFILNSFMVAAISVTLNVIVSSLAAFAFSRIDFKGKNGVFLIFLSGMMIPAQATMIPLYIIMAKLGLVGSLWALILPAMISPLSIFLMRQFMMTIPKSYDEAASIDGARRLTVYWKVILPMSKPVILMSVIQSFLASWNNFMGPLIYLSDWNKMTLPIGLRVLNGYMGAGNISEILAGITVSLIAPVLLYAFGQKYLIEGIALSGVKS